MSHVPDLLETRQNLVRFGPLKAWNSCKILSLQYMDSSYIVLSIRNKYRTQVGEHLEVWQNTMTISAVRRRMVSGSSHNRARQTRDNMFRCLPKDLARRIAQFLQITVLYNSEQLLQVAASTPLAYLRVHLACFTPNRPSDYVQALERLEEEGKVMEIFLDGTICEWREVIAKILETRMVDCFSFRATNIRNEEELAILQSFSSSENNSHLLQLEVNAKTSSVPFFNNVLRSLLCHDRALKYLDCHGRIYTDTVPCYINLLDRAAIRVACLRFSDVCLSSQALASIANELKARPFVKQLDLSVNIIGDEGVKLIADALTINVGLKRLILIDVGMTSKAACALASALTVNRTLESFAIFDNDLGEIGGEAIGRMLRVNQGIKKIALKNCNFDVEGCDRVLDGVIANTQLEQVTLAYNSLKLPDQYKERLERHCFARANLWMVMLNDEFIAGPKFDRAHSRRSKILKIRRANFRDAFVRYCSYLGI